MGHAVRAAVEQEKDPRGRETTYGLTPRVCFDDTVYFTVYGALYVLARERGASGLRRKHAVI